MLSSPLHYDKLLGRTIDLSQLVEVGDAYIDESHHKVGFYYRYAAAPAKEYLHFERPLRDGPWRNPDMSLRNPSQELDTLGEELYIIYNQEKTGPNAAFSYIVIHDEESGRPLGLINMERQVEKLIETWQKWKAVEPEIYAVIRKHLA